MLCERAKPPRLRRASAQRSKRNALLRARPRGLLPHPLPGRGGRLAGQRARRAAGAARVCGRGRLLQALHLGPLRERAARGAAAGARAQGPADWPRLLGRGHAHRLPGRRAGAGAVLAPAPAGADLRRRPHRLRVSRPLRPDGRRPHGAQPRGLRPRLAGGRARRLLPQVPAARAPRLLRVSGRLQRPPRRAPVGARRRRAAAERRGARRDCELCQLHARQEQDARLVVDAPVLPDVRRAGRRLGRLRVDPGRGHGPARRRGRARVVCGATGAGGRGAGAPRRRGRAQVRRRGRVEVHQDQGLRRRQAPQQARLVCGAAAGGGDRLRVAAHRLQRHQGRQPLDQVAAGGAPEDGPDRGARAARRGARL